MSDDFLSAFKQYLCGYFITLNSETYSIIKSLESTITRLKNKLKQLQVNYLQSSGIDPQVFENEKRSLEQEISEKELKLGEVKSQLSNPEIFIDEALETASNLHVYWKLGDWATKQRIQRVVFPEGVLINPAKREYLTPKVNQFFNRIRCLSSGSEDIKKEKVGKNADPSSLVAGTGLEPVTFGL